ncbi:Nitrile hydratase beta subunit [Albimonas donghaensis]|uniref:Nitrile hydratase beta subunit n=2 Tax=Albimonas donghaensis TaxID=356660 RepID=A0A1H2WVC0_9RHOB|nr:nitrile hydratase subunit beta [Paracoccaceae bacterium]MBR29179.1 nitrile hydratase subunit beta [Paracoccaceae bacterium]SDW84562.1 Nitrile hydratase beta subunit [Albimonas donghaensis]
MGGLPAGPVVPEEHDYALWERRVDALLTLATTKGKFTVDGLRRVLEDMGPEFFETHSYYERWIESVNRNLIESGLYSTAELAAKLEEVRARGETYGECSLTAPEAGSGPEAGDG